MAPLIILPLILYFVVGLLFAIDGYNMGESLSYRWFNLFLWPLLIVAGLVIGLLDVFTSK